MEPSTPPPGATVDLASALRGYAMSGSNTGADAGQGGSAPSRLSPATAGKLPLDTVAAGLVTAGVRLELAGTASAVRLTVVRHEPPPQVAPTMAAVFSVWLGDQITGTVALPSAAGVTAVDIPLPPRTSDEPVVIYLPDSVPVTVLEAEPFGGALAAASRGPRWLAYGDSITQGWSATDPGRAWPATVARRLGLDLVNLGFAGSARGELPAAAQLAETDAEVITLAWGTNCWSSIPTDAGLIEQMMRLFVTTVRQGHPDVPLLVVSPIVRPAAENAPNRYGATLADLRTALERAAERVAAESGDTRLSVLPGRDLVDAEHLVDGIHPGDHGHSQLASAVAARLADTLSRSVA
jgi:lysophospholipase L1-like esterase